MEELLRQLAANNFADLEGLQITGTLPVRQDLVNGVITDLLQSKRAEGAPAPAPAPAPNPAAPVVPPLQALQPLQPTPPPQSVGSGGTASSVNWWKLVNKLEVRMTEGRLIVDFELRR